MKAYTSLLLALVVISGCARQAPHEVLPSVPPGLGGSGPATPERAEPSGRAAGGIPGETAPSHTEAPGSGIEQLGTWEDVLEALPKDQAGGADWVRAVREGVVMPRSHRDPGVRLEPPFTLDTLVQGIGGAGKSPLDFDVEMIPEGAPFFAAVFPHSSHTLWLNCSSCHPGIVGKRAGMSKILEGEHCGVCHGKVAFAPETGCARCHANLVAPDEEALEVELATARASPAPVTPELLRWGKDFYQGLCAICHGADGDGSGPFARFLDPKPRDFTEGTFKFRTTPSGSLPSDLDLFRTITMGLKGTGMPAWSKLPQQDRWALVHYIKTFSEIFEEEEPEPAVEISDPPPGTPEQIATGAKVYDEAKCWDCHGEVGRGDGPSAGQLQDDWGAPILPADFTKGVLKAGQKVEDVFRSISTGLDGTPMPSYGDVLSEEERWAASHYVVSLSHERGFGVRGDIDFQRYSRDVMEMPPAKFPHWRHRVRFRCTACHPSLFRMKAGANPITMDALRAGEFCAQCHNGRVAWYVGFDTCRRCHPNSDSVTNASVAEAKR